jgi:hypothetical protein
MPEKDVEMSKKLIKLVVDFASNRESTLYPDWQPLNSMNPRTMVTMGEN